MAAFTAALAMTGCGSAAAPGAASNAAGSTSTGTPAAAASGDSGGVADTPMNPDRTDICDVAAMSGGQTIAYLTVAGSDTTAAQSECSTLTQSSGWTAVASTP